MPINPPLRDVTQPREHTAASIRYNVNCLHVRWTSGEISAFPALWLRDNIASARHRDNGQRIFDAMDLAQDTAIGTANLDVNRQTVAVHFKPDALNTEFDAVWLARHALPPHISAAPEPRVWDNTMNGRLFRANFATLESNDDALRDWLRAIRDDGVALLHGVPQQPGQVCRAAELIGYVRETNYGRLFDVVQEEQPDNLAFSNTGLGLHTDNPYRDPVPGLQFLHCLEASANGGESLLSDGFRAARELREEWPSDFATLTQHSVLFRYQAPGVDLQARAPLIETDEHQRIRAVRYNNRSIAPLDLPAVSVDRFYGAYRRFGQALHAAAAVVSFSLQPGDLLVVDNQRVLHGRRGFSGGRRHLQGCYADQDTLLSRLRIMEKSA